MYKFPSCLLNIHVYIYIAYAWSVSPEHSGAPSGLQTAPGKQVVTASPNNTSFESVQLKVAVVPIEYCITLLISVMEEPTE